ncbi:MAG: hypothetical protein IKP66_01680 [Lachnospiraceae bacterium]|nr:hypothetical protein [Lachnospiraceae bacterium]
MRYFCHDLTKDIVGDTIIFNRFTHMTINDFITFQNTKTQKLFVYRVETKRIPRWGQPSHNEYATYNGFIVAPSVSASKELLRKWYGPAASGNGEGSKIVKLQLWAKLSKDEKRQLFEPIYDEELKKRVDLIVNS